MISERIVLSANQTKLKTGEVKFYNNFLPTLPAGEYSVLLTQEIEGGGLDKQQFKRAQEFEVAGPRFRLPEGEIHSVYPPPNGQEYYEGVLPQITFRKRTLPWERSVDSKAEDTEGFEVPWMALLLFEEQELQVSSNDRNDATRTRAVSRKTAEFLSPTNAYLPPLEKDGNNWINLEADLGDEDSCYTIDIDTATFESIVPKAKELAYLAHVREVNTDDKEFLGMHADGWFSVMLTNRLPKTPPMQRVEPESIEEKKGLNFARNIVHLVSLEGFIPYLEEEVSDDLKSDLETKSKVRLVSLASWEFYCKPPLESFTKLMENLDAGLLKLNTPINPNQSEKHAYLKTALDGGYVPLQYNLRNGEKTMAWYRGPLLPVINEYSPENKDEDIFFSVEASMIYDQQKGLFDLSQAVAWQIGRLLALNDAHFSQHLLDWKKKVNRKIDELLKRQELALRTEKNDQATTEAVTLDALELKNVRELMDSDFATDIFSENFLAQLAVAKSFFEKLEAPTLKEMELSNLPGILSKESFEEIMEAGQDLETGILNKIMGD